jgi:hypothetical protein
MAEIIIIHNKPKLRELLASRLYRKVTQNKGETVLEDFNQHKAICHINEEDELEYITDYISYDPVLFANSLRARFNAFWIDQKDLIDYNKFSMQEIVDFDEFLSRLDLLMNEMELGVKNQNESKYLWKKLSAQQRAKVLPGGYLKNYLLSQPVSKRKELDLLELFEDSRQERLSFGIVKR